MRFLERTGAQLMWGLHNLRFKVALFLRVMPPRRERREWVRWDIWERATYACREASLDRYHRRFGARVFVRVYAWLQVYAWVRICLGGGNGEQFRSADIQREILNEAMIVSARVMGGELQCVSTP